MKVSLRPADGERDSAATTLVRKVEVSYRDSKGQEKVREDLPVLGLSQPVSMRADLMKDVPVEKEGLFEARGYGADGSLLLSGQAQGDPDSSEAVEIILDQRALRPSGYGSPLLRRVRLVDAQLPTEYSRDAHELRTELESEKCLDLPPLIISANGGSHPKIVLEGTIKSPSFGVEIALGLGGQALKALGGRLPLTINSNGDAELELGRRFLGGLLLKNPAHLILRVHSDRYEGCLSVSTRPSFEPVTVTFALDRGVGLSTYNLRELPALGRLEYRNPNEVPVWVRVRGLTVSSETGKALQACFHHSNDVRAFSELTCASQIEDLRLLQPGERAGISIFATLEKDKGGLRTQRIESRWNVETGLFPDVQDRPTQVPPGFIP